MQNVARGLGHPTAIAFDPAGGIWTTSAQYGVTPSDGVWYVKRRGARPRHVVSGLNTALGLTWFRGKLYVSHVVPVQRLGERHLHGPRHRVLALQRAPLQAPPHDREGHPDRPAPGEQRSCPGPAGAFTSASAAPATPRPGSRYGGTVVSFKPGGGGLRIEARGLRNPYGLAFAPDGATLLCPTTAATTWATTARRRS